jgi:hypothetical protein
VRVVRAAIAPGNTASWRVLPPGFVGMGQQIDPDDGLEVVWELPLR